jgi:membrane-bound serine protease (ClpP class)
MTIRESILVVGFLFAAAVASPAATDRHVGMINIDGAIDPATADYISRAIDVAAARNDACLIIQLDTPGGLVSSAKEIIEKFYASPVPTVVYVAPAPASAGSAGVFITMAADVAAMAPNTSIGAAHPVNIGGNGEVEQMNDVMRKKMENYVSALAETVANKRHRNADWAKSAVLESSAITAEKALSSNVIDLIAKDVPDLLRQLDGRKVGDRILQTAGARVVDIPMTVRERFLRMFLRPEVMFVLMLFVIYGIIGELSSPGAVLPGVAGAIALILVLYMSSILPVTAAGLALLALALALFIVDIYAPTHGILTAGGIAAFFLGSLMLFDRSGPFQLPLIFVVTGTATTALFFLFVVGAGLRAQHLPVRAGMETMIGKVVPALEPIDAQNGWVFVEGERWKAVSLVRIEKDQPAEIIGVEGLTLKVKPKQS